MATDFTLTPQQRELEPESRRFAAEVRAGARAAELLPTAEERFLATRLVYPPNPADLKRFVEIAHAYGCWLDSPTDNAVVGISLG